MLRSRIINLNHTNHGFLLFRAMATKLKDYVSLYDVMEIHPECTKTEIREAWLRLSMTYHPDLNKDNEEATKKFMEIKEAYKVLVNDEKRQLYNNKIGFYHSDPPPDFKREWTYEGEKERSGAAAYHVLWSEEAIRKLISSDKLRDMNWAKQPPSERFKILMEEEDKLKKERNELARTGTLSLKVGFDRYCLIVCIIFILYIALTLYERQPPNENMRIDIQLLTKRDIETEGGGLIKGSAQIDTMARYCFSWFEDPKNPKYWVTPGTLEGAAVHPNTQNAPNPSPLDNPKKISQ